MVTALAAAWMAGALAAGGSGLVVADGSLRPGRAAVLEVGETTGPGEPSAQPPALEVSGGAITGPDGVRPGVWRWRLVPDVQAGAVQLRLGSRQLSLATELPRASSLQAPAMVEAVARGEPVSWRVSSSEPVPVDALEVITGEGQVARLVQRGDEVEVEVILDDLPHPRWVPVVIRDRRRDELPAWTAIRVKARPRIPMHAEPGAQLTLRIGARTWGPFKAAADGRIEGRIEQLPGENTATAILVDDLGNRTQTEVPLVAPTSPALVAMAEGQILPGRPPPQVALWAIGPSGGPPPMPPTCRPAGRTVAPGPRGSEPLPLRDLGDGRYLVAIPALDPPSDVRITCTAGATTASVDVAVASGVAATLSLRVWPDELTADDPSADVSVVLDDARGERLPVRGVAVGAERGEVSMRADAGIVARGTYDGEAAVEAGGDRVSARYSAPPGSGPPRELLVRTGPVPQRAGEMWVHGRALDADRRPLADVPLRLRAGGGEIRAVTGPDGWASGEVSVDPGTAGAPFPVEAVAGAFAARAIAIPGEGATGGPGTPDLEDTREVQIRPGRVRGISIEVEPSILRAAPGAVAYVTVRLQDGAGQPVLDEAVELAVTEGEIGELRARGDGSLVATYTPLADDRVREIEITASTPTLRSSTHLELEPRVVQVSFGPWIGAHTNFGALTGPSGGLDLDLRVRTPLLGETAVLRFSAAAMGLRSEASTGVGPSVDLRSTVVPLSTLLLFRQDRAGWAVWAGGGGTLAPRRTQLRFGDDLVSTGFGLLVGPVVAAGASRRAPGGEVVLTLQASWLPAPRDDVGYSGNLGGVLGGLGYRLVY
jgi:hypothetical protein